MTWTHLLTVGLPGARSIRMETWGEATNEDILRIIAHLHAIIQPDTAPPSSVAFTLPLSPQNWAILTMRHPLTQAEWDQMHRVLAAMYPGLVKNPRRAAGEDVQP